MVVVKTDRVNVSLTERIGKSDPFVVFQLNGQKVYKSQTKKKTLNPDWHESFSVQVVRLCDSLAALCL